MNGIRPLQVIDGDYNDFVLTYSGRPLTHRQGFLVSLRCPCEKAGLPYGRKVENGMIFHDFRRTVKIKNAEGRG